MRDPRLHQLPCLLRTVFVRSLPILAVVLAACGGGQVTIQVTIPDQNGVETPVPGVRFIILPYDRDSILEVLEQRAPSPRPSTARLDSLFQAFREPFTSYLRLSTDRDRLQTTHDSLARRLEAFGRDTPEYQALYAQFQSGRDSLERIAGQVERARRQLDAARRTVMPAVDSIRAAVVAWEDTAFRAYDSITARLAGPLARADAITDSTRADGWVTVGLKSGDWWVYARAINLQDPNAEWYWNIQIEGDTVRLGPSNGRSRPRFK